MRQEALGMDQIQIKKKDPYQFLTSKNSATCLGEVDRPWGCFGRPSDQCGRSWGPSAGLVRWRQVVGGGRPCEGGSRA